MTHGRAQEPHSPWEKAFPLRGVVELRAVRSLCKESLSCDSLRFALAWPRIEAATFAHALPKAFSLLRTHVLPAFSKTIGDSIRRTIDHAIGHAAARTRMPTAVE